MRKILLASHGNLAGGMYDTLRYFVGDDENIRYINAYEDGIDIEEWIGTYFKQVGFDDEVIVFTDIVNGSVNRLFMNYMDDHIHLIAGMNLGLILEFCGMKKEPLRPEVIERTVTKARSAIIYVNTREIKLDDEDE